MASNKDILLQFGLEIQREIVQHHIAAGQRATGDTMNALEVEASEDRLIISGPAHLQVLEDGRRSGKRPPVSVIERWILAKGIKPTKGTVNSLAWAITKKIGLLGTALHRKGGRRDIFSNVITGERVGRLSSLLEGRFANLIKEEVLVQFER